MYPFVTERKRFLYLSHIKLLKSFLGSHFLFFFIVSYTLSDHVDMFRPSIGSNLMCNICPSLYKNQSMHQSYGAVTKIHPVKIACKAQLKAGGTGHSVGTDVNITCRS